MIVHLISLYGSYLDYSNCVYWFFPFVALGFLTVFPRILRSLLSWR